MSESAVLSLPVPPPTKRVEEVMSIRFYDVDRIGRLLLDMHTKSSGEGATYAALIAKIETILSGIDDPYGFGEIFEGHNAQNRAEIMQCLISSMMEDHLLLVDGVTGVKAYEPKDGDVLIPSVKLAKALSADA